MNAINSNKQMIQKINEVLQNKKDAVVNIVNDKLTISVFSLLEKNLQNVKEINFVIRDVKFLPHQSNFRKRQLERLKDEVIDIEDANENISLTDLNMNEYLNELSEYIQNVPEIKKVPKGVYSVTDGGSAEVLFCFKHRLATGQMYDLSEGGLTDE